MREFELRETALVAFTADDQPPGFAPLMAGNMQPRRQFRESAGW